MSIDLLEQIKQKIQRLEEMIEEMCKSCREDKAQREAAKKVQEKNNANGIIAKQVSKNS
jgi:hypothetical protein